MNSDREKKRKRKKQLTVLNCLLAAMIGLSVMAIAMLEREESRAEQALAQESQAGQKENGEQTGEENQATE